MQNSKSEALSTKQIDRNRLWVKVGMLESFNHLTKRVQHLNPNPMTILFWSLQCRYRSVKRGFSTISRSWVLRISKLVFNREVARYGYVW